MAHHPGRVATPSGYTSATRAGRGHSSHVPRLHSDPTASPPMSNCIGAPPPVIPPASNPAGHLDDEQPPKDACGVFGVWAPGEDVAKLTYYGLYAPQHRGQEAAGMSVSDGTTVVVYKALGLVAQVFAEATLSALAGHLAIGHCRYSTTG